jgi:hypothetical protein
MKRADLLKLPIIKFLSSIKLTLISLIVLSLLIIWGTVYQAEHGLYLAQEKFFNSFFFTFKGIPLPTVRSVMWVLFINLSLSLILIFQYRWSKLGLWFIHLGIIILLVGGFYNLNFSKESLLQLKEGEASNISADYYDWLLEIRHEHNPTNASSEAKYREYEFPLNKQLLSEKPLSFLSQGSLEVKDYYENGQVFDTPFAGIIAKELPLKKEQESNFPVVIIKDAQQEYYLSALNQRRLTLASKNKQAKNSFEFVLKRREYQLPVSIQLLDVKRDLHQGTQIAKSYESKIAVIEDPLKPARTLTVAMNKPFRYKEFTFFQSSYGIAPDGSEFSALAVVENKGRLIPYISGILASLGLLLHFIIQFWNFIKKKYA